MTIAGVYFMVMRQSLSSEVHGVEVIDIVDSFSLLV